MTFEEFDQKMRQPGPIVLDSENQASKEESVMTNAQNAQVAELTKIVETQAAQIAALTQALQALQQMTTQVQAPAPVATTPAQPANEEIRREKARNSTLTRATVAVENGVRYLGQQAGNVATTATEHVTTATEHVTSIATTAAALGLGVARTGLNAATQVGNIVLDTAESLVDPTLKGLSAAVEETGKLIRSLFGR